MRYESAQSLRMDTTAYCTTTKEYLERPGREQQMAWTLRVAATEAQMLRALTDGPKTAAELAECVGVSVSTAQSVMKKNMDKDVQNVRCFQDYADRRRIVYSLT